MLEFFTYENLPKELNVSFANKFKELLCSLQKVSFLDDFREWLIISCKIWTFWEAYKIWKKSSSWFGRLQSKCTKHEEDYANLWVLLRKSELYHVLSLHIQNSHVFVVDINHNVQQSNFKSSCKVTHHLLRHHLWDLSYLASAAHSDFCEKNVMAWWTELCM